MGKESRFVGPGKLFKIGNKKLGPKTLIFNMTSATYCPSRELNLCRARKICYAKEAEIFRPSVLEFRIRQEEYWNSNKPGKILWDIEQILKRQKTGIEFFRYNEAGDFRTKEDIFKLVFIAEGLNHLGIRTYGYTAREDLKEYFKGVPFVVRGSGFELNHGQTTTVFYKKDLPKGFYLCPGKGCSTICRECMNASKRNIAFKVHGRYARKEKGET